ncbi:MAG: hypothetical protein ACREL3_05605 [Gemmatimonadales bacterium]
MTPARSPLPVRWKTFGVAVTGVLAATLWLRVTSAPPAPRPPAPPPHSIAVVPFVSDGPDSSYDYLGEGITGDLTGVLGRIPGLRVAVGGSGLAAGADDPSRIGRKLGVGSVLLGTVRQAGDRLRVTAHLVSVDGGFDVWSEAYEREAADLLEVENEILAAIAAALRLRSPGGEAVVAPVVARTVPAAHAASMRRHGPGSRRRV